MLGHRGFSGQRLPSLSAEPTFPCQVAQQADQEHGASGKREKKNLVKLAMKQKHQGDPQPWKISSSSASSHVPYSSGSFPSTFHGGKVTSAFQIWVWPLSWGPHTSQGVSCADPCQRGTGLPTSFVSRGGQGERRGTWATRHGSVSSTALWLVSFSWPLSLKPRVREFLPGPQVA